MAEEHAAQGGVDMHYLDPGYLFAHVRDTEYFDFPRPVGHVSLPQVTDGEPIVQLPAMLTNSGWVEPLDGRLTRFMVLEVIAAILVCGVFIWLAGRIGRTGATRGRFANMLETMLIFLRDEVARPAIGSHDADKFLPFIWSLFFFVLTCNLLGMVPWMGSPTGALAVTGMLAFITFAVVVGAGSAKMGPVGFWVGQVPHMDLPFVLAIFLKPMIFFIEVLGLVVKHFVLAVRLVANMLAGHLVLFVLIAFIGVVYNTDLVWGVAPASVLAAAALSLLELFVAFLQAYIFAFLAALFIGAAVHPH